MQAKDMDKPFNLVIDKNKEIQSGNYTAMTDLREQLPHWELIGESINEMSAAVKERELRSNENIARMTSVLGGMAEGVIAIDSNQHVLYANRAVSELLSIPNQDFLERPLPEVVRVPAIEQAIRKVFENRQTIESEFETIHGVTRILSLRCSWISAGANQGALLVLRDITNVRVLETMRRDFVANVSHELKTPLSSIKGYAETLRLGAIDDVKNRGHFLSRIESQAERLHTLIIDLLELARIETGKISYEVSEVDIVETSARCIQDFQPEAQSKNIALDLKFETSPIFASADPEALRSILVNLLSNAVRYSPDEGDVIVSCKVAGSWAVVEVSDSGLGIAPEHQERIFERFYRVDKARSTEFGGTGLGLAIVKHLAQSFGGGVSVESKKGSGSTFSVRLPVS